MTTNSESSPSALNSSTSLYQGLCSHGGSHVHCLGDSVYPYLDDWLFIVLFRQELTSAISILRALLASFSVCINEEKLVLLLMQMINSIGVWLDSVAAQAFLPPDCFATLTILRHAPYTVHHCLSCLGHIVACMYMTLHACLCMHCLQLWLISMYRPHRDHLIAGVMVPQTVLASLSW